MSSYYDIDSILSEEERVPSTFNIDGVHLGFLDPSSLDEDLQKGTKIELPFWMAKVLHQQGSVGIEAPKHYRFKFLEHMEADPSFVNLREKSPYYFELGKALTNVKFSAGDRQILAIGRDLASQLDRSLRAAISGVRFQNILDRSFNSGDEDMTDFTRSLTNMEQELFRLGCNCARDFYRWKSRQTDKIEASDLIRHTKRQRTS